MIEASIFAALSPLVAQRVYPDVAPEGAARPYITYQQVGGQALEFVEGTDPDARNARMQINVWSDSRLQASQLAAQIASAMRAATSMTARPLGAHVALHEPEFSLYGAMQDFDCWAPD